MTILENKSARSKTRNIDPLRENTRSTPASGAVQKEKISSTMGTEKQ